MSRSRATCARSLLGYCTLLRSWEVISSLTLAVSTTWVLVVGVFLIKALVFGVHIRTADFGKGGAAKALESIPAVIPEC